jgi:superfamily II DNA/RNA helicase
MDKLIAIVDSNNKTEIEENVLNKEETLLKILNSKPTGKFLIFSKNENTFDKIKLLLTDYKYDMLKGNTSHMLNVLNKFKNGNLNIIFLNTQYAGSGIDISDATDIIIFHKMGIDKEQAIGRAQRVGRTSELYIHNLCYDHEL